MSASPRPPGPRLLYLGVLLFAVLAAVTFESIRREWGRRIDQSRAGAIFELVEGSMPARPTETPGVAAWLHLELERYRRKIADPEKARLYGEVAEWHDGGAVPPFFAGIRDLLAAKPPEPPGPAPRLLPPDAAGEAQALQFRTQRYVDVGERRLVVTRRRALDTPESADLANPANDSDRFLFHASRRLLATGDRLQAMLARHPLPALPGDRPPEVVRLYAVAEDGTLLSLPLPEPSAVSGTDVEGTAAAWRRAALDEGREFRKLPELPSFISNEFAFRFDFSAPEGQSYYSGLYLDLGGRGVVATITVPVADREAGYRAVLAADLTFGIDWDDFAARIDPPLVARVVRLGPPPAGRWRPWTEIRRHLGNGQDGTRPELAAAVAHLARQEARQGRSAAPFYLYHGVVPGRGAVATLQVARTTWLVTLFPETRSSFALLPALLLGLLLVLLLAGFEASRRRTERAQRKAERELAEKQNLLDTMQVPLMVVDPNTDEVVYGNRAAASLGIAAGVRAGDLVADDPRAREHYDRMQVAGQDPRRAYGVPLKVRGEGGREETRYAIVRSVAVTAPIETLRADERHRLGILFLLEPEADLALFTEDLVAGTQADERRKLAGLLTHGVDTLARVLDRSLAAPPAREGEDGSFAAWLAGYLERRLHATAWLLEHWDAEPPLPPDNSIEADQARSTIDRFQAVFERVREDPALRSRLHWDNGVLATGAEGGEGGTFAVEIDWPEDFWFACPLRGGFGFFLGEVMVNAIRHGRPGSRPTVAIHLDRVRKELLFAVENELPPGAEARPRHAADGTYGGRRILERLAHLFEWKDLAFEQAGDRFRTAWRVRVSERGDPRRAD